MAGLSSRFGGKIKPFAKVGPNQEPLIEISLNRAIKAGFDRGIFVVGPATDKAFKEYFGTRYKGIPIEYALQSYDKETRDKPWGTADAICSAKHLLDELNEPFLICTGDDLYSEETFRTLFNHSKNEPANATVGYPLINHLPEEGEVNRGIFHIKEGFVTSAEEVHNISKRNYEEKGLMPYTPCNIGIFLLKLETLNKINEILLDFKERNRHNRTIECYINVELGNLVKNQQVVLRYYEGGGQLLGITNPEDEQTVREILKKQNL